MLIMDLGCLRDMEYRENEESIMVIYNWRMRIRKCLKYLGKRI